MNRVAYVLTHPIQYQVPLVRHLRGAGIDVEVIFATDAGSRSYFDRGFGQEVLWDLPLLEGYPFQVLEPGMPIDCGQDWRRPFQKRIHELLRRGTYDCVWVHGWKHPVSKAAWEVAQENKLPLLLRGETSLKSVRGNWLRRRLHKLLMRRRFKSVAAFLTVGSLNRDLYKSYGVEQSRLFHVPYTVDNFAFQKRVREAAPQRERLRADLGIEEGRPVILFCGRLTAVKSPATLIYAIAELTAGIDRRKAPPFLLIAGDGELRAETESLARREAPGCVRFLGFQNQSDLPPLYDLCDIFVLPSIFEPWGLVVNEVMNAAKPVVVSDAVGAGPDLVSIGENGDIFVTGNVEDLCQKLRPLLQSQSLRRAAGERSLEIIENWSFDECAAGLKAALLSLR